MKPVPGKDLAQSMVKMHVDRFSLPDIASDSDVLGKLLAIKFTLADIYTTDELLSLFFDLTFGAIPAKRGDIFLVGRNLEKFKSYVHRLIRQGMMKRP